MCVYSTHYQSRSMSCVVWQMICNEKLMCILFALDTGSGKCYVSSLLLSHFFFKVKFHVSVRRPTRTPYRVEKLRELSRQALPAEAISSTKRRYGNFNGLFPPEPAHCVSAAHRSNKDFFLRGVQKWHQRKMRGRLHEFRNSLLVSIQQQHKSRFSAAGAAPLQYMRTNIVSTCSLVRFL